MPKIKYLKSTVPPVNGVQELFRRYSKARCGQRVAEALGMDYDNYRAKLHRGKWTNEELRTWCEVLKIPAEEIGRAILQK